MSFLKYLRYPVPNFNPKTIVNETIGANGVKCSIFWSIWKYIMIAAQTHTWKFAYEFKVVSILHFIGLAFLKNVYSIMTYFSPQVEGTVLNSHMLNGRIINLGILCSGNTTRTQHCLLFKFQGTMKCKCDFNKHSQSNVIEYFWTFFPFSLFLNYLLCVVMSLFFGICICIFSIYFILQAICIILQIWRYYS